MHRLETSQGILNLYRQCPKCTLTILKKAHNITFGNSWRASLYTELISLIGEETDEKGVEKTLDSYQTYFAS